MTQVRNRVIKTNVWNDISWISNVGLCRFMMLTCLNGTRLSDSSGWNGPLTPLGVKLPLLLAVKPWQNLLSRSLSRHQNEMVVMPSKIVVMPSKNATVHSCTAKTLAQNSKGLSWIQRTLRASGVFGVTTKMSSMPRKLTNVDRTDEVIIWDWLCICDTTWVRDICSNKFSRGLVQASAVIGYLEVSSKMKIRGPHRSVILSTFPHTNLFT